MLETRELRQAFYQSEEWRNLRKYVLDTHPLCVRCEIEGKLIGAKVVDHILDLVDAPELALEISNLQGLCYSCHSRKTLKTERRKEKERKNPQPYKINQLWR